MHHENQSHQQYRVKRQKENQNKQRKKTKIKCKFKTLDCKTKYVSVLDKMFYLLPAN